MIFLQMDECAGQLNQPLEERAVRPVLVLEPDVFEHVMRLEKFLPVEQLEIAGVMRVGLSLAKLPGYCGDAFVLVAHELKVKPKVQRLKSKVMMEFRL